MKRTLLLAASVLFCNLFASCDIVINNYSDKDSTSSTTSKVEEALLDEDSRFEKVETPQPAKVQEPVKVQSNPNATRSDNPYAYLMTTQIDEATILNLSRAERRIYRNAIYAMHGYIFNSADLRSYFSQFTWYQPITKNVQLSNIETWNVNLIKSYE